MDGIWNELKFFHPSENWGDPHQMSAEFLKQLDCFHGLYPEVSFQLTSPAFSTYGHAENSYHYLGRAADLRFIDKKTQQTLSLAEHFVMAMRSPFGGIGIYTYSPNGPFIHFDNRLATYNRKIWVCETKNEYRNLDEAFLRKVHLS